MESNKGFFRGSTVQTNPPRPVPLVVRPCRFLNKALHATNQKNPLRLEDGDPPSRWFSLKGDYTPED